MDEKRRSYRVRTSWKVYDNRGSVSRLVGYLMNISESGAKIYLQKEKKMEGKNFKIKITPPASFTIQAFEVEVKKIWEREEAFLEVGIQFLSITERVLELLKDLIRKFNYDKKALGEIEIIE